MFFQFPNHHCENHEVFAVVVVEVEVEVPVEVLVVGVVEVEVVEVLAVEVGGRLDFYINVKEEELTHVSLQNR